MGQLTLANVSKYLTHDVIDKVFKTKTNSEDNIKSVEVSGAAAAGEGMISAVYKIKVTGNEHTERFIAKGLVQNNILRNSLKSNDFFRREALFFSKILPVLIDIQKTLGAKESIKNHLPECYGYYVDGNDDYILMEDMSVKELTSLPKKITKYERDIILKVLAHFHSVSLALRVKRPDIFANITNDLDEVYYNADNKDWYAKYLETAIAIDKKVVEEMDGKSGKYYKKFEEFLIDNVYDQLITLAATRGDNPIINHGDAWYPNFLCCKERVAVIDFQIVRCASPATDLSYFIMLCSNLCASKEDFFEAVDVYYKALEYYLKDMGIDADNVFSLNTLKEELKKYGKFGLLAALTTIPLIASERYDILQSPSTLPGCEKIPLEELWKLSPILAEEDKQRLMNAVRVAVEVGLI